ncbi:hypothetical protein JCM10135_07640 [Stetteria hydrogenophila]
MAARLYAATPDPSSVDPGVRARLERLGVVVIPLFEACSVGGVVVAPPRYRPPAGCRARLVEGPPSLEALADYLEVHGSSWAGGGEPPWRDPRGRAVVVLRVLGEMRGAVAAGIPGRPPPLLVASEVYADSAWYDARAEALARAAEGADFVVAGAAGGGGARAALGLASWLAARGIPAGFDYWDESLQAEAVEAGASLVLSLTPDRLDGIPPRLRGAAWFVLVPSDPRAPWRERVESLVRAASRARGLGYSRVVVDPVLNPPVHPGALEGLIAARVLSERLPPSVPVMLGLNNFYELVDADSTGVVAALAALAVEAGVSLVLVGEESWKARGATLEARLAADMASLAARWRVPPKDLGLSLLTVKEKRPSWR